MLDYFEILLGLVITIIISMVLGTFTGSLGSYVGFLIVTIYVGYRVNQDIANGALHGALVGLGAGFLSTVLMMAMGTFFDLGPGSDIMSFGVMGVIIGLTVDGIIGAVGGAIGSSL